MMLKSKDKNVKLITTQVSLFKVIVWFNTSWNRSHIFYVILRHTFFFIELDSIVSLYFLSLIFEWPIPKVDQNKYLY